MWAGVIGSENKKCKNFNLNVSNRVETYLDNILFKLDRNN